MWNAWRFEKIIEYSGGFSKDKKILKWGSLQKPYHGRELKDVSRSENILEDLSDY